MKCGVLDLGCQTDAWLGGLPGKLSSAVLSWIPDWVWPLLPYWPWIIIVGGAGMAYRFGGWPAVVAFFGGVGFFAGRKSAKQEALKQVTSDSPWSQLPAPIPVPRPKVPATPSTPKKRKTLQDWFKSFGS